MDLEQIPVLVLVQQFILHPSANMSYGWNFNMELHLSKLLVH